jgi:hypothetical protein
VSLREGNQAARGGSSFSEVLGQSFSKLLERINMAMAKRINSR